MSSLLSSKSPRDFPRTTRYHDYAISDTCLLVITIVDAGCHFNRASVSEHTLRPHPTLLLRRRAMPSHSSVFVSWVAMVIIFFQII